LVLVEFFPPFSSFYVLLVPCFLSVDFSSVTNNAQFIFGYRFFPFPLFETRVYWFCFFLVIMAFHTGGCSFLISVPSCGIPFRGFGFYAFWRLLVLCFFFISTMIWFSCGMSCASILFFFVFLFFWVYLTCPPLTSLSQITFFLFLFPLSVFPDFFCFFFFAFERISLFV